MVNFSIDPNNEFGQNLIAEINRGNFATIKSFRSFALPKKKERLR